MKGIEGSTLGRYELRHRIARGGMSEVYLGYDRRVKRRVAVKVLYGSDEPFVRRFEREALAVGALSHDHILPLYDFGEQRPWYYLVMPFVEGGTLRDYLLKRERLTLDEAGSFLEQIASALQYAHDHDVVHRDVKPSNILLRPDGYAYLGDFGLAKAKMEAESFTHAGTMIGTPEYMAPEQSDGRNDHRSDIYSLGIILYQMLTGQVPFMAESPVAVTLRHIQAQPIPPSELNSEIPPAVEEVMLKALAKDPDERYQQAKHFALAYKRAVWQERLRKQGEGPSTLSIGESIDMIDGSVAQDTLPSAKMHTTLLAEHDARELDAPTPLFPLAGEISSLPSLVERQRKKQRIAPAFLALLCLVVLGIIVPSRLLQHSNQPTATNKRDQSTRIAQMQQLATATRQASVQATLAAQARIQARAGITTALGAGKVLYASSLTAPEAGWLDDGRQCHFSPQGYRVYTPAHGAAWCYFNQQVFSNTVITVQAQLLRGDIYGLVFRLSPASKAFYVLELNSQGEYRFLRAYSSNLLNWLTLIDWTYSPAIYSGYGQTNILLIVAKGASFSFYINKQLLISAFTDFGYRRGFIGFLVGGDSIWGTEAIFNDLWVFKK